MSRLRCTSGCLHITCSRRAVCPSNRCSCPCRCSRGVRCSTHGGITGTRNGAPSSCKDGRAGETSQACTRQRRSIEPASSTVVATVTSRRHGNRMAATIPHSRAAAADPAVSCYCELVGGLRSQRAVSPAPTAIIQRSTAAAHGNG